ncbi:putative quinol monooxygenase [Niallia nealsonii]|uniref:putative quinol monooxygenase n=1 Tax=Niallia nealsonii TaxID=115979 RepID=UPI00228758C1|nr:putative quinol monooxygenase [Niallia nealsonii]
MSCEKNCKNGESFPQRKGCLNYLFHESLNNDDVFVFYENWVDEEAIKFYNETEHYLTYKQNVEALIESKQVFKLATLA